MHSQTELAIPIQSSSCLVWRTAAITMMSTSKMMAMMTVIIRAARDGAAKERRMTIRFDSATLVKLKAKKVDPRACSPGGVTNVDTSSALHHNVVRMVRNTVTYLTKRTVHRL
jgi:hypothetical protein